MPFLKRSNNLRDKSKPIESKGWLDFSFLFLICYKSDQKIATLDRFRFREELKKDLITKLYQGIFFI
jgi:hypothetical protein